MVQIQLAKQDEKTLEVTFSSCKCPAMGRECCNRHVKGHSGAPMMQIFTGTKTKLTEAFSMTSESQMAGKLKDFIRKRGAPDLLIPDNAKSELVLKLKRLLECILLVISRVNLISRIRIQLREEFKIFKAYPIPSWIGLVHQLNIGSSVFYM